jgi:hypothetical protein
MSAHQAARSDPPKHWPALLLPVRLETRRVGAHLCIRVFPDQPFVDSHQERLTQEEHDAGVLLASLVDRLSGPDPPLPESRAQWLKLARRYGSPRAAWIVRSLREDSTAALAASQSDTPPRLFLLPERFLFLLYKAGRVAYHELGTPSWRISLCSLPWRRSPPRHRRLTGFSTRHRSG